MDAAVSRSPLSLRAAERPGSSPLLVAIGAGLGLGGAFLAAEALLGRLVVIAAEPHALADFRIALALIGIVAYLLGVYPAAVRGVERTLRELAPAYARPEQADEALAGVTGRHVDARLRRVGWAGALAFLLVPLATNLGFETYLLWRIPPEAVVHRLLLAPMGWLTARVNAVIWIESRRLFALGSSALRIDLLDFRPLAPLARAGLRHTLFGAGLVSFLLVALRDEQVAPGLPYVLAVGMLANLAVSGAALWLAVGGAHRAIVRAKAAERAHCDALIRAYGDRGARLAPGGLADALAWRRFVEEAPDWPLDLPTLRRFALSLGLPLLSWAGGALMEVVVGHLLGP